MFEKSVAELIRQRSSCRSYRNEPVNGSARNAMESFLNMPHARPFNSDIRFKLAVAEEDDSSALKGLGTYGIIRNPQAFIIGAVRSSVRSLEDYGYVTEKLILRAADLGLGSCWLGGSFRKSRFASSISASKNETVPAVVSIGYPAPGKTGLDRIMRISAGSDNRKPWEELFFDGSFDAPLAREATGAYHEPLEMLRLAPSASNRQPWRIVREVNSGTFHFYLERSRAYTINLKLLGLADLQRVDMGIAMCHFELTALENKLTGTWTVNDPGMQNARGEYIATWIG